MRTLPTTTFECPVREPFSLAQALTFIRRFPPNRDEFIIGDDWITAAFTVGARAVPVTIRAARKPGPGLGSLRPRIGQTEARKPGPGLGSLEVEVPADVSASEIVPRVSSWLGADHDLTAFYAIANTDRHFAPLVDELHGLHHVAFVSLAEIAVYCVMMQRAPITMAARMKARFLDRFGLRVAVDATEPRSTHIAGEKRTSSRPTLGPRELRSMPELAVLATLDGDEIAEAIRHKIKGPKIATVVKGVAKLGEAFLREAPYEQARDALLEIPGVGPFSAGAILLRGLGRMEGLPPGVADDEAKVLYGRAFDRATIEKRYGAHIGYWSYYVKTGVARQSQ